MIIDCISDLHGHYPELEGGDLLIVAGDLTARDEPYQYIQFALWLNQQKYKYKILVGGNHDNKLQEWPRMFDDLDDFICLCDSGTQFQGLKIWGSPWNLSLPGMNPHCMAFTVDTDEQLAEKWAMIPDDTDILVTHSPAFGFGDEILIYDSQVREMIPRSVGSPSLTKWIANHVRTLKLHVVGHIHEGYGIYDVRKIQKELGDPVTPVLVNSSHVNEHYEPVNKPIRIEL